LGGGGVARARFLASTSSGVIVIVGLAVAEGVPVVVGAPVPLALPLALAVALGVLARAPAVTAVLLLPAFEPFCSWLPRHPAMPEQVSRVKASAACRYRLFVEAPIVFPHGLSTLMKL
jgi:hypothetical protein